MTDRAESIIAWLTSIPDWLVYVLIGGAAAIENLIPPLPSDVVVVVGGVAAGAGTANPNILFVAAWLSNVASALLVYWIGYRYGAGFFAGKFGKFLLAPAQVQTLTVAYRRFGFPIIFFSRFLPVFRPIVPVFAGVARLGFWETALPIALASAAWYGLLVYLGNIAGSNWRQVLDFVGRLSWWLWVIAAPLLVFVFWWWRRTRSIAHGRIEHSP